MTSLFSIRRSEKLSWRPRSHLLLLLSLLARPLAKLQRLRKPHPPHLQRSISLLLSLTRPRLLFLAGDFSSVGSCGLCFYLHLSFISVGYVTSPWIPSIVGPSFGSGGWREIGEPISFGFSSVYLSALLTSFRNPLFILHTFVTSA